MVKVILDRLGSGAGMSAMLLPLFTLASCALVAGFLLYFQRLWVIRSSRRIEYAMRRDLFADLIRQPKVYFDRHTIGDIMSRATNDLDRIRDMVGPAILHLARMGCLLIYTTFCIWKLHPRLMLIGLLPSLIMPIIANAFLKKMYGLFGGIQKSLSGLNAFVQDSLSGIQVVKAYGKQEEFQTKFTKASEELRDASLNVAYSNSIVWPAIGVLGAISTILVIGLGGRMVIQHEITVGSLSAAVIYLLRLQFPLVGLGWVMSMIQRGNVSIDRLIEVRADFEKTTWANSELKNFTEDSSTVPGIFPSKFEKLEIRNLGFAYPAGQNVLEKITLTLHKGESLGIVGAIGSGKTTLLHLICGIYMPKPNTLFLNGKVREEFSPEEWKKSFAYAPQDGFLFSTTIRENIAMGQKPKVNISVTSTPKANAETPEENSFEENLSVEKAGEWSAFARDLQQIPHGYEALLGEKGINLSGGQRQRVGLARALAAGSPVLCLDDTLSALDTETENVILTNLREHFAEQTLILISHRLSAVSHCSTIIFLQDGKIVEQGKHAELLALNGQYAEIWEKQKLSRSLEIT